MQIKHATVYILEHCESVSIVSGTILIYVIFCQTTITTYCQ